ncbi:hypothetical protein CFD26_100238 [Aspergillus turcosus]|uniref:Uncharacterized protein n=1 Tax=Aspergillus turcosus TaxID=1245748 RepID=A0A421CSM9_9EURO|nr:hypothetical protein CFD26_100238 [Aspergillus turcosus]
MIENKAPLDPAGDDWRALSALGVAVASHYDSIIPRLLEEGAQTGPKESPCPVEKAVRTDQPQVVELLLKNGIRLKDDEGLFLTFEYKRRSLLTPLKAGGNNTAEVTPSPRIVLEDSMEGLATTTDDIEGSGYCINFAGMSRQEVQSYHSMNLQTGAAVIFTGTTMFSARRILIVSGSHWAFDNSQGWSTGHDRIRPQDGGYVCRRERASWYRQKQRCVCDREFADHRYQNHRAECKEHVFVPAILTFKEDCWDELVKS